MYSGEFLLVGKNSGFCWFAEIMEVFSRRSYGELFENNLVVNSQLEQIRTQMYSGFCRLGEVLEDFPRKYWSCRVVVGSSELVLIGKNSCFCRLGGILFTRSTGSCFESIWVALRDHGLWIRSATIRWYEHGAEQESIQHGFAYLGN